MSWMLSSMGLPGILNHPYRSLSSYSYSLYQEPPMSSKTSTAFMHQQTVVIRERHLVAIAAEVVDHASIISQIRADAQVIILDSAEDSIAQLTAAIQHNQRAIRSLHIISHGAPGQPDR